jgi:hypothetical protein
MGIEERKNDINYRYRKHSVIAKKKFPNLRKRWMDGFAYFLKLHQVYICLHVSAAGVYPCGIHLSYRHTSDLVRPVLFLSCFFVFVTGV